MLQGDAKGSHRRLPPQPHIPVSACAAGDIFPLPSPRFRDVPTIVVWTPHLAAWPQPDGRRCSNGPGPDSIIFYTDCVSNGLGHTWMPVSYLRTPESALLSVPTKARFFNTIHKFLACKSSGRDHSLFDCAKRRLRRVLVYTYQYWASIWFFNNRPVFLNTYD